jgi:hypothetical protein
MKPSLAFATSCAHRTPPRSGAAVEAAAELAESVFSADWED